MSTPTDKNPDVPFDGISDEDLAAAFDEAIGVSPAPVQEPEPPAEPAVLTEPAVEPAPTLPDNQPELPDDHGDRSRLGRKLKGLYAQIDSLTARIEQLSQPKAPEPTVEDDVPEIISSPEDVEKYLLARERQKLQATQRYEQSYLSQIKSLEATTGELHGEVWDEMLKNFNIRHSDNAAMDARINYAEAKAAVLARKASAASTPKLPTAGGKTSPPVVPSVPASTPAPSRTPMPKLDAEAMEYVRYLKSRGMSDEDIAKELQS